MQSPVGSFACVQLFSWMRVVTLDAEFHSHCWVKVDMGDSMAEEFTCSQLKEVRLTEKSTSGAGAPAFGGRPEEDAEYDHQLSPSYIIHEDGYCPLH
ncbi:hypothetical protein VTJ04DRAFT_1187 [Mycothermus thermophilus]|uniref:uncharacterized protein n=1 Tax=Humicola insolens TaxID=85995 RepID=UPI0037441FAD